MSIETTKQMRDQTYIHINLDYMDMMSDGDDSMKKVMLEMLLEELPMELEKMNALTTEKNWVELGAVSHKMKSTLSFVGNEAMTNANKDIEQICKDQNSLETIPGFIAVITEMAPKALDELRVEFERL